MVNKNTNFKKKTQRKQNSFFENRLKFEKKKNYRKQQLQSNSYSRPIVIHISYLFIYWADSTKLSTKMLFSSINKCTKKSQRRNTTMQISYTYIHIQYRKWVDVSKWIDVYSIWKITIFNELNSTMRFNFWIRGNTVIKKKINSKMLIFCMFFNSVVEQIWIIFCLANIEHMIGANPHELHSKNLKVVSSLVVASTAIIYFFI